MFELSVIKVVLPWLLAFLVGLIITPLVIRHLYHFRCWKKQVGNDRAMGSQEGTPIFNRLHADRDTNIPRMGGLVIVVAVLLTTALFWLISYTTTNGPSGSLDFLSRSQTWLPLVAFIAGALIGLIDDLLTIGAIPYLKEIKGLALRYRLVWVFFSAGLAGCWFYFKFGYE